MFGSDEVLHEGIDVAYGSRHKVIKPDKVLLNIIIYVIPLFTSSGGMWAGGDPFAIILHFCLDCNK